MSAPLIAIAGYHLPPGRVTTWNIGAYAVPDSYIAALRRAGAQPALLPMLAESPEEALEPFDGLLLVGGGDVDPSRYGAEPHPQVYGVDPERDAMEIGLIHAADAVGLPTLAICRGIQIINVAFGGTLHQHLPDVPGLIQHGVPGQDEGSRHEVKVAESSRVAEACGQAALVCASHHHQAVDRLGGGLVPVAWSEDGLVEAVERDQGWLVAVQWHPEDTAAADPAQQALFDALAAKAAARSAS